MGYCGENTAVKHEGANRVAVSLKCKSWTCAKCMPRRKAGLIANGFGGVPNIFLTLTHRRTDNLTAEEAAKRLVWAWRCCRKRLMRKHGWKKIPFLAVMEKHKSGWPHLHILIRGSFIPWIEVSNIMKDLINSPRVNLKKTGSHKEAIGYCVKYCGKAAEKFASSKRYWQSRDYDLRDEDEKDDWGKEKGDWDIYTIPLWQVANNWEEQGHRLEWHSWDKCILIPEAGFT